MNSVELRFVGRERQLETVSEHVDRTGRSYLIAIHGRGGIGKTWLMRRIHQQYSGKAICFDIVDFSRSKTRVVQWLMDEIARQATDGFDHYNDVRQREFRQVPRKATVSEDRHEDRQVFLDDFAAWEAHHGRRCLFFFDTVELIQDTLLIDFLAEMVQRSQNTAFLVAGRRCDELTAIWRQNEVLPPGRIVTVTMGGFDQRDAVKYIRANPAGDLLTEEEQETLYLLSENGVPLKLALALDWLSRGLVLPSLMRYRHQELLELIEHDEARFRRLLVDFERELVLLISELSTDADRVLNIMAHVHLRFNRELLKLLLPDANIEDMVSQLQREPFHNYVKFIEPDYFVLHDEIQRMIVRHIWDGARDKTYDERTEISKSVITFYERKLAELQHVDERHEDDETWILEIEKLYYELDISLVQGYSRFVPMFEELKDRRKSELAALALDIFLKDRPLPPELRRFADTYCRGWLLVRQFRLREARAWITARLPELEAYQDLTKRNSEEREFLTREVLSRLGDVYTLLGYCNRLLGDWAEATRNYEQACELTKQRLRDSRDSQYRDPMEAKEDLRGEQNRLAEILNDIANLKRMQGQLKDARLHCKVSLIIRERLGETRLIAHSCYVMSMILWESGNTAEAAGFLRRARLNYHKADLELLERAWVDRFEGYVMLRTDNLTKAFTLLVRARDRIADEIGLQDEHAEVLLHLSRLNRMGDTPSAYLESLRDAKHALSIAEKIASDFRICDSYLTLARTVWKVLHLRRTTDVPRVQTIHPGENESFGNLEDYLNKGERIAKSRGYRRFEALFADLRAEIAYERNNYSEALRLYTQACILSLNLKPAAFARALSRLTDQLYKIIDEDPDQVLTICDQIMLLWNEDVERDFAHPEFRSEVVDYIQRVAREICQRRDLLRKMQGEMDRGLWQAALQSCDEIDGVSRHDSLDNADVLFYRALACYGANDFPFARLYGERAARIWRKHTRCQAQLIDTYLLLSRVYWQLGNPGGAADMIRNAEGLSEATDSDTGRCRVLFEWGYIYFRTSQYDLAKENLQKAQIIARNLQQHTLLGSILNLMSRIAQVDPIHEDQLEIGFQEARLRSVEALQILGNQDWLASAETYLTLCILHYRWGKHFASIGKLIDAQKHFDHAAQYHYQGWISISEMASPMLHSIYRGMQGNLLLVKDELEDARFYFLKELIYATKTKHMRFIRALDLIEQWLIAMPANIAAEHSQWLSEQWKLRGYSEIFPEVIQSLDWFSEYRNYIPEYVSMS